MDWEALHKKEIERIEKLQAELNKQFNKVIITSGTVCVILWIIVFLLLKGRC